MNINALMSQAKKMQAKIEKEKQELEAKEYVVEKQGIKVVVMGNRRIKSVELNEILIDPEDKEILEDMIIIAINEANDLIDEEESKLESGNSMPGMPGMPF